MELNQDMGLTTVKLSTNYIPLALANLIGKDEFAFNAKEPTYDFIDRAWVISAPAYLSVCGIVDHPKVNALPRPRQPENWRVGFVQNVLYQSLNVEYENGSKQMTWPDPLLDAADQVSRPFCYRAAIVQTLVALGSAGPVRIQEDFSPYRDVVYGPAGLGELKPSTQQVVPAKDPLPIHFGDAPGMKVDQKCGRGTLQRVLRLSVHRLWVLAIREERRVPLAFTSPFTMASHLEVGSGFGISTPPWKYHWSVQGSDQRRVDPERLAQAKPTAPQTHRVGGGGVPVPKDLVLTGPTANEETQKWAREVKLSGS
jgi:hypothetical protein